MKTKVIISDFDGTLAKSDHTVSSENVDAINRFIENGNKFALCSGRATASILREAKNIGLKGYVIGFNGGEMADIETGRSIYREILDTDLLVEILTELEKTGAYIQTYTDKVVIEKFLESTNRYLSMNKTNVKAVGVKLSEYHKINNIGSGKILVFDTIEMIEKVQNIIEQKFSGRVEVSKSERDMLEITKLNITKKYGMIKLLEHLNESKEHTIAIGDSGNDIAMLLYAKVGIAVANALERTKQVADIVLSVTNNQNALKYVIDAIDSDGNFKLK